MRVAVGEWQGEASAAAGRAGESSIVGSRSVLLVDAFLPHAGGSRVYYYNLYRRLAESFHRPTIVLTTKTPGDRVFDARETFPGFEIMRRSRSLPDWRIERAFRVFIPFLWILLLRFAGKADLLHAGDLFPQGLVCVWMKWLFGTPFLAYAHGEEITQTDRYGYQATVRDLIYRHADAVIAANDFAREQLLRVGVNPDRIHTIYPGVDSERFCPAASVGGSAASASTVLPGDRDGAQEQQGAETMRLVVLSVGRLVPHKGHSILIDAIAALPASTPRPRYIIAGEGPERESLVARVAELGLSDDVVFLGKVKEEELAGLYTRCDVFALANREHRGCVEGFGMVFLEAAACGKPVLAGRTGGTAGAVVDQKTGLLFDPDDLQQATAALNLMLSNPDLRERMGRAGRERAIARFSWDRGAQQLDEVCAQILENGCRSTARKVARHA